jgi:hypothetical protein
VVVPAGAVTATFNQIVLTVGDYMSPSAVTMTVQ